MAINVSSAGITDDVRNELLGKEVDLSINDHFSDYNGSVDKAGITASFAKDFQAAMIDYSVAVKKCIDKLEAVDASGAFKGEQLQASLTSFVEGVEKVANDYNVALANAEREVIASVAAAYKTQDTNISTDLTTDTNKVSDAGFSTDAVGEVQDGTIVGGLGQAIFEGAAPDETGDAVVNAAVNSAVNAATNSNVAPLGD